MENENSPDELVVLVGTRQQIPGCELFRGESFGEVVIDDRLHTFLDKGEHIVQLEVLSNGLLECDQGLRGCNLHVILLYHLHTKGGGS